MRNMFSNYGWRTASQLFVTRDVSTVLIGCLMKNKKACKTQLLLQEFLLTLLLVRAPNSPSPHLSKLLNGFVTMLKKELMALNFLERRPQLWMRPSEKIKSLACVHAVIMHRWMWQDGIF